MYLSRVVVSTRTPQGRKDASSRYEMHRSLERVLSQIPGRCLWRLERRRAGAVELLVQTPSEPDWGPLAELEGGDYLCEAQCKRWEPGEAVREGALFRFLAEVNPTQARRSPTGVAGARGARKGVVGLEEQYAWLRRQGELHGFELLGFAIRSEGFEKFRRGDSLVTVVCVVYEGHLRVTAPEPFLSVLRNGLGKAKGFGFGLLSLA